MTWITCGRYKSGMELLDAFGLKVTVRSIQKVILATTNIRYCNMNRTKLMTPTNKKSLSFALGYISKGEFFCFKFVFSDENKLILEGPDGFEKYLLEFRRYNVLGCDLFLWLSQLVKFNKNQNSHNKYETIQNGILPWLDELFGETTTFIFRQENQLIRWLVSFQ